MGGSEGFSYGRVETKEEIVEVLRAWATHNLSRNPQKSKKNGRGLSYKNAKDISWVHSSKTRKKIEAYRFDKFIDSIFPEGDCLVFNGAKSNGYRQFLDSDGKTKLAHRISYEMFKGELIKGLVIDHICRNRACVNPEHLRQVTQQTNILAGNGQAARNAKKTHCKYGHEFVEENTYVSKYGRGCVKCRKSQKKEWDIKNKERLKAERLEKNKKKKQTY